MSATHTKIPAINTKRPNAAFMKTGSQHPRGLEPLTSRPQDSLKIVLYRADASILHLPSRASNDFHSTFGNFLTHSNRVGDSDQICVLKLDPRTFVPVVQ